MMNDEYDEADALNLAVEADFAGKIVALKKIRETMTPCKETLIYFKNTLPAESFNKWFSSWVSTDTKLIEGIQSLHEQISKLKELRQAKN